MRVSLRKATEGEHAIAVASAMEAVEFRFGDQSMDLLLGYRCTEAIAAHIGRLTDRVVLVADRRVYSVWGESLRHCLAAHVAVSCFQLDAAESEKSLGVVQSILDQAVAAGATRRSVIVSLGGGLTGNLAGLAAGLLFRGVRLMHVPTTLLAMSDSVLSQKQAVNGVAAKNLYGLYHPAQLSCIDVQYLQTLPPAELSAGIVELCKNGLAFDVAILPQLERLAHARTEPSAWLELVKLGIRSKQLLLRQDPLESGCGVVLEYGHTVGHALELETGTLTHGNAVGLGMLAAASISRARGWLSEAEEWRHAELLVRAGAPVSLPRPVSAEALLTRIRRDNKRGRIALQAHQHAFVLLRRLGQPALNAGLPLVAVDETEIRAALEKLSSGYYCRAGPTS
ncbi:3-dehydroquinate synthase [Rhizobiales bacterium GAS188]|nr:3-dehydroquinate synthase [Rhizobiales bacterium GAS188]